MEMALSLAERGQGRVSPNPLVGAVLVKRGRVVGRGWHRIFGGPHAEVEAIRHAGGAARGATLYVTLEPCSHFGKTPPCTDAILEAGVVRVVAAMKDPNPSVPGRGAAVLRRRGVPAALGLCAGEARELNRGFATWATERRPFVTVKLATSLDGAIATRSGDSRWITGPAARKEAHRLRARHDAIVAGAATVDADDPLLTVRHVRGKNPARIVLDPAAAGSPKARWLASDGARRILVTGPGAPRRRVRAFERAGAEVWALPSGRVGGIDLKAFVRRAAGAGIVSLLVEGGGRLAGAFIAARLADRMALFTAPVLLGGSARRWTGPLEVPRVGRAPRLDNVSVRRLGDDWLVEGEL